MKTVIIKDANGRTVIKVLQKKSGKIETLIDSNYNVNISVRCDDNKWIMGWKTIGRKNK